MSLGSASEPGFAVCCDLKRLVDHGLDDMVVEAYRFPPGAKLTPDFIAAVVLEGSAEVNGERLGKWTFSIPPGRAAAR